MVWLSYMVIQILLVKMVICLECNVDIIDEYGCFNERALK